PQPDKGLRVVGWWVCGSGRRALHVPMAELRDFIDGVRVRFDTPYPLAHRRPYVAGRQLLSEAQEEAVVRRVSGSAPTSIPIGPEPGSNQPRQCSLGVMPHGGQREGHHAVSDRMGLASQVEDVAADEPVAELVCQPAKVSEVIGANGRGRLDLDCRRLPVASLE